MIVERVHLWTISEFDAVLQAALCIGDESAWLRQAFAAFVEKLDSTPPAPRREVKMNLLSQHGELLAALERLTPTRRNRALLLRAAAYYQLGLLERQPIDVADLAARLLAAMNQRGFVVEKENIARPPSDSEMAEVLASIGQFHRG